MVNQRELRNRIKENKQKENTKKNLNWFLVEMFHTLHIAWKKVSPILNIGAPLIMWLVPFYSRWFKKLSHDKNGIYSRTRGAYALLLLTGISLGTVWLSFTKIVPTIFELAYDVVAYNLLDYEDVVQFSAPQWVGESGVISVMACRKLPCRAQDDSIEFRIRESLYLDIVRFFTHFEPHDIGEVAGGFPGEENICWYRAYGKRFKYLNWYPYIIDAECVPGEGSIEEREKIKSDMKKEKGIEESK